MTSLKAKLTWGLMLSLVALLVLQWVVVTYAIARLTEGQLIDRLEREGENILASAYFDKNDNLQFDFQRMGAIYHRPFSGHYYIVLSNNNQQQISRSLWDYSLDIKPLTPGQQQILRLDGPEKQPLLVVVHGYQKQSYNITVAIAEDLAPLQSNASDFQKIYAAVSAVGLLLLLLVQRLIVLSSLKPLRSVKESMARLERGQSDYIEVLGPSEIRPLIEEFNRLLAVIDLRSKRTREALGNLAHALKTRLTLINQIAEQSEINESKNLRASIYASTEVINNIIERELKRARLLGDIRPGRYVDLKSKVAELVHTLRLIYAVKDISITWKIDEDAKFIGDQEDLFEMLGNLLDNACKWCASKVYLTVTGGDCVSFIIEDDGPGSTELEALTRRGFRLDESKPGSGLGLAIVSDIVESYDGSLNLGRSVTLGGLMIEAKFHQAKLASSVLYGRP